MVISSINLQIAFQDIKRTVSESATMANPVSPGKYYVTVVAYNRALERSDPVCSDGVFIDQTEPGITSIEIERVRVRAGLVEDRQSGEMWFIGNDRRRCKVGPATSFSCM